MSLLSAQVWADEPTLVGEPSLRIAPSYTYYSQANRELQTGADTVYEISAFSGAASSVRILYDLPLSPAWAGQIGLGYRRLQMEGDAKLQGSIVGSYSRFHLLQEFLSFHVGLRLNLPKNFSLAGIVELAVGKKVELTVLSGSPVDAGDLDKPFFLIFGGEFGYEYRLNKNWGFNPSLRLGAVATADPIILTAEFLAAANYYF